MFTVQFFVKGCESTCLVFVVDTIYEQFAIFTRSRSCFLFYNENKTYYKYYTFIWLVVYCIYDSNVFSVREFISLYKKNVQIAAEYIFI